MPPVSFIAKRSVGLLAGSLAMAAALAWFIRRQRSKSLKRLEAGDGLGRTKNTVPNTDKQQSRSEECCRQEANQESGALKMKVQKEQTICDSGGGGDAHESKKVIAEQIAKQVAASIPERESYEINSSTESSSLTSEHCGDVEDMVTEECNNTIVLIVRFDPVELLLFTDVATLANHIFEEAQRASDQAETCEQSETVLKLDTEEAPFSWSDEVEMSALSKLSSPMDNNVTMSGASAVVQPQNGDASYKPADSPSARSEVGNSFVLNQYHSICLISRWLKLEENGYVNDDVEMKQGQ
ncbi:unnamed protein product [Toxocara canis]|uniref:Tudor domain-containing protein n=1 Tax=Toxocara canis TaxID=6265 RepID=A0A183UVI3_TOXCA|nr:unnamed protein product [Toxocara canis]